VLAGACGGTWVATEVASAALRRTDLWTGGALYTVVGLLALFNARKKIPFAPAFTAAAWMQFHIYAGLFSAWLFLLHTGARAPRGALETAVWMLFAAVTLSGVAGLALTRWAPGRLTLHGENLIFERIPALRAMVRAEAEKLAVESAGATQSSTVADFYEARLQPYFGGARPRAFQWMGGKRRLLKLIGEIEALDRYLSPAEREIMGRLAELVRARDNLDFQYSLQALLKGWLFVHIPLTWSLIIAGAVHGVMAWSMS
jgi:hypothetical protein